ncbi:MAG TPA: MarR family transcriptional regulator [Marmoricola sp.]|jgi:DNA-binding MarR family transcriptional regulator|nr:MarR family transcriptional regulator [Marmoricola sp.]
MTPTVEAVSRTDAGLASQLRVSVMKLARRIRNERTESDLTVSQISVLGLLFRNGELTVGKLASQELVQPPTMTRTVNALVEKGYAERRSSETDGRAVLISLSEKGREQVLADRSRRDVWLARQLGDITTDERELLRQVAPLIERLATS